MEPLRRPFFYWIVSLLLLVHACAVSLTAVPSNSALYVALFPYFKSYWHLTGTWQSWKMFHSIPYDHAYDIEVTISNADDHQHESGFVLPNLLTDTSNLRLYKLYSSFHNEYYDAYRQAYLKSLGPAIKGLFPDASSFHVRMTSRQMCGLQEMRESGQVTTAQSKNYGPFKIE
jgi:hypothetical protein